ncbi:MAG: sensor domain-containing diguanylate cyclase [Candidatus Omnitrophica bacterium]|nr:sensor domain-containing diguanylate cyclase [Candidatus Omnitrophota bacterium]
MLKILILHAGKLIFLTGLVYLYLLYSLIQRYLYSSRLLKLKTDNFNEEINILIAQMGKQNSLQSSFEQKIDHYNNLRNIANKIQNLSLQQVSQYLVDYVFFLIGKDKGTCLLYLVEPEKQKLNLFLSKKEDRSMVIKQKRGDVFDRWMIKHSSSLLVRDTKLDYRFDLEKTEYKPDRTVLSLISSPLKVEQRFLGILRLDSEEADTYSQEDLRLLDTICNLGAMGFENALLFQRTQELAIKDSLTLTYTRGYFLERLNHEIKRTMRLHKQLALLMIDIDNFKDYNDKYGHIAGDILLKGLSILFLEFFSKVSDAMVCRFGGEEFSVFLPSVEKKQALELAEDLRKESQKKKFVLRRKETFVTVSIGVTCLSLESASAQDLILKADAALYNSKRTGRNKVCFL